MSIKGGTYDSVPIENLISVIPTLFRRTRRTSVSLGRYPGVSIPKETIKIVSHKGSKRNGRRKTYCATIFIR